MALFYVNCYLSKINYFVHCFQLSSDSDGAKHFKLLNIFAYGTYKDYVEQAAQLPPMSPAMSKKLRQLTVVSLAAKAKVIMPGTLTAKHTVLSVTLIKNISL